MLLRQKTTNSILALFLDDLSKPLNILVNYLSFFAWISKIISEHFPFHRFLKNFMGDPQNDSKWDWHQTEKKHAVFPAKFSLFFLKKKRGPKKNALFAPEVFGDS